MLTKQNIEFELKCPGSPGRACTLYLVNFMTKQKSLGKILSELLFTAKILPEAMFLPPMWAK